MLDKSKALKRDLALVIGGLFLLVGGLSTHRLQAQQKPTKKVDKRTQATEDAVENVDLPDREKIEIRAARQAHQVEKAARQIESPSFPDPSKNWSAYGIDFSEAQNRKGTFVQRLSNGAEVTYTVDPTVQAQLEATLDKYEVPHGSVVVVEPATGRVLAMVNQTRATPKLHGLATKATAPSASIFKVITAAALLEETNFNPDRTVCYSGGESDVDKRAIERTLAYGHKCAPLGEALGKSINTIFAKLTYRFLDKQDLEKWAERFGFNQNIPFAFGVERSKANVPDDPIERARTAAGFWNTYMSPLHGALISAAIANDGVMMKPHIIDTVRAPTDEVVYRSEPETLRRVVDKDTAETLRSLLRETATDGTADKYFAHRPGFPQSVKVGGKTGTLANSNPYLSFSWFIGYGIDTNDKRSAAVGSLVCNKPEWRIKGPYAASEAFNALF